MSLKILKQIKNYRVFIVDQNKNIVSSMNWKQYIFDFDLRYRDQKLIFVYDQNQNKFLTNEIFPKIANIINDNYLRYGKNIDINTNLMKRLLKKENIIN